VHPQLAAQLSDPRRQKLDEMLDDNFNIRRC
jgi:hypothetical protein